MDLAWSDDGHRVSRRGSCFLRERLTPELQQAGRLMTSVYSDHDASLQLATDPARARLGGAGVAGGIRRLRLEPDAALHLQPRVDARGCSVRCRRWAFAWSRTRSSPTARRRRRSTSCRASSPARCSSARATPNRRPVRTSRRCRCPRWTTATTWCARAARSGRRTPARRTGCSPWSARHGRPRSSRASPSC